jgi:type III restriction enzyme
VVVLETKGDQLDNLGTAYKREWAQGDVRRLSVGHDGTSRHPLSFIKPNGETVECTLILVSEWQAKLPNYLKESPAE